jgi:hypothetical protein
MSPPCGVDVFEAGVAVVERDPAIEALVQLDFGAGETEASLLRRDLQAAAFPLHDVVVADDAFMEERADALELVGSGTPGFGGVARSAREAAVVVGEELSQDGVGGVDVGSFGEAEFAAQAVLEDTPEAFDAAFGLRRLRGDEGDAELRESAAEWGRLALAGEFFFERPVRIAANEDATAVAVESGGNTGAAEQVLEQAEIAFSGFCGEELRGEDFSSGVILHAQSGEARAATFEPVVRAAVELHEFAFAGGTRTALTMSGRAAFAGRSETCVAKQATQGFASQREALDFTELFAKMVIVETGVLGPGQAQHGQAGTLGQPAVAGAAAVGVSQRRLPGFAQAFLQALNVAHAQGQEFGGAGTRHVSLDARADDAHSLQFLLTQRVCLRSHGATFSRCF